MDEVVAMVISNAASANETHPSNSSPNTCQFTLGRASRKAMIAPASVFKTYIDYISKITRYCTIC